MIKPATTYQRMGKRALPYVWLVGAAGVVFVLVFFLLSTITKGNPYRKSVVLYGHPTHIVSWGENLRNVVMLDIPSDVVIDASHGYGQYAVESIYTLDQQDHKGGNVFVDSLTNALGVPLSGYAAVGSVADAKSSISLLRSLFSWSSIPAVIFHRIPTSIDSRTWISMVIAAQSVQGDSVKVLGANSSYIPLERPDGSRVSVVDPSRFDYIVGNAFLDGALRSEGVSIAVYNTTDSPFIGQKAARVMSRLGLQLVFVGNSAPKVSTCEIQGSNHILDTKTAQFIRDYFHCANARKNQSDTTAAADLVVLLGTRYASQFEAGK